MTAWYSQSDFKYIYLKFYFNKWLFLISICEKFGHFVLFTVVWMNMGTSLACTCKLWFTIETRIWEDSNMVTFNVISCGIFSNKWNTANSTNPTFCLGLNLNHFIQTWFTFFHSHIHKHSLNISSFTLFGDHFCICKTRR